MVLTVTQMLRKKGVVGKFVEYFGDGLDNLTIEDQATIANNGPGIRATCGFFPVTQATLDYLTRTGRAAERVALVEAYAKEQGLWSQPGHPEPTFSDILELDLASVTPSMAGPKRPQDRVALADAAAAFKGALLTEFGKDDDSAGARVPVAGETHDVGNGDVVIAAITSCTNTSNPGVLLAAGLLAKNAVAKGLKTKPWVKTSLAPGSQVVTDYLKEAGLTKSLDALGFNLVGYGCTTCIGNSGPLPEAVSSAIQTGDRVAGLRALRQPQFRRPGQPEHAGQLSRQSAAGGRLCLGRVDDHRPRQRAARPRQGRQAGVPEGHLAHHQGHPGAAEEGGRPGHVRGPLRRRVQGRQALGRASMSPAARPTPGTWARPMCRTRPTSKG